MAGALQLNDAIFRKDTDAVRALITANSTILNQPVPGADGYPPLLLATVFQAHDVMRVLLDAGADPNKGPQGWTPLMQAASLEDRVAATMLLDGGADINARAGSDDEGDRGATALMEAAEVGDIDMINLLVSRGADTKVLTRQGRSAINFTLETSHGRDRLALVEALLAAGTPPAGSCLSRAIEHGDLELMRRLLRAGADPNVPASKHASNWPGATPLMLAIIKRQEAEIGRDYDRRMGHPEKTEQAKAVALEGIRMLIAAGADVSQSTPMLGTPLEAARHEKDVELIKLLSQAAGDAPPHSPPPVQTATPDGTPHVASDRRPRRTTPRKVAGARDFLKMVFDSHPEWAVLMVEAPIDDVVDAMKKHRKIAHWQRDVPVKVETLQGGAPLDEMAIVQLKNSQWTILIRSLFEVMSVDLVEAPADAKALSKLLKTRAAVFMGEDTSGAMGYECFERGQCTELIHWAGDAVTKFESTLRDRPHFADDDAEIADGIFRGLGVYVPCCFPQADDADAAYLAAANKTAEHIARADLITL